MITGIRISTMRSALLLLCAFASCSSEGPADTHGVPAPSLSREVTPPQEMLAILRESDGATLYRVTGELSDDLAEHKTKPKIGGYPKIGETPLPDAGRREIADILSESRNYLRENETWTCLPQPFYLIRANRTDAIDVIVHECGAVEMHATIAGEDRDWQHGLRASSAQSRLWAVLGERLPGRPSCGGGQ